MPLLLIAIHLITLLSSSESGVNHHLPSHFPILDQRMAGSVAASGYVRQQLILGPALNVTAREGDQALLPCIVPHLGEKTVSWIRQKDLAILTSSIHVYTSDTRVESFHPPGSDLWGLQISPVRSSDEGFYQCQVNTEPKLSRIVVLVVLEQDLKDSPAAAAPVVPAIPLSSSSSTIVGHQEQQSLSKMVHLKIAGDQDKRITESASLLLACSATLHQDGLYGKHIELAWWKREIKLSDKMTDGHRINIQQIVGTAGVVVELEIHPVKFSDSGRYYCRAEPKYVSPSTNNRTILKEAWVNVKVVPADQIVPNQALSTHPTCLSISSYSSLCLLFSVFVLVVFL